MSTSSETQYLIGSVAQALQKGLSEVILKKPHDPIEYLATWLYAYQGTTRADREEILQTQKEVKADKAKRVEEVEHEQLVAERENVAAEEAELNFSLQQAEEHAAPQAHNVHEIMANLGSDFSDKLQHESGTEVEHDTERGDGEQQQEHAGAADLEEQEQMDEQQVEAADEQAQETARTDHSEAEGQAFDDQLQLTARSDIAEDQPLQEETARSQEADDGQLDEQDAGAQDDQQADEPSEQAADTARSEEEADE